jgi:tetratricopeptide (TPR) repeat protein
MIGLRSSISLSIRELDVGGASVFGFHILLDGTVVASNLALSPPESGWTRGLAQQFGELFEQQHEPQLVAETMGVLGDELFRLWFGQVWDQLVAAIPSGTQRLLLISSNVPDILNLPWELMRPPGVNHIGLDPKFRIRRSPSVQTDLPPARAHLRPRPLRVLFLACAPIDQEPLDYEQEEALLLREVARAGPNVAFDSGDLGTFEELRERVNEYQPHVIHLHGHGYVDDQGQGYFLFEDEHGGSDERSSDELRQLLAGSNVQCVFVSGCQTARAPAVAAVGGICQGLVSDEVPLAIGWAASISDDTAMVFARVFYNALAAGQPIDRALFQARQAIQTSGRERSDPSWLLPVLYAATDQELLFDPDPQVPAVPPLRPNVVQQPLPGMTEGFAELVVGRRRELQRMLPRLRDGRLQVLIVTGMAHAGKSTLATRLARKLEVLQFRPIAVPSSQENPLSATRLLQLCGEAFLAAGLRDDHGILRDPNVPVTDRLHHIVHVLNRNRFVLVLDNFEVNMDESTRTILDRDLADFYSHLLLFMSGGSRAIVTSRYRPETRHALPSTAEELPLGDLPTAAFYKVLLHDEELRQRYFSGELPHELLVQVNLLFGGNPGFLHQIRGWLKVLPPSAALDELRALGSPADAEPSTVRRLRDAFCERIVVARLFGELAPELRRSLCRAAVYAMPVDLPGLSAVTGLPLERVPEVTRQWQDRALAYPLLDRLGAPLWAIYGVLRSWLLDPERLEPGERRDAHLEAGNYLLGVSAENRQDELSLTWVDALLEARAHYLEADERQLAWLATQRLSEFLAFQGLHDDVIALNTELLGLLQDADLIGVSRPTPALWIAITNLNRGDYPGARAWYERCLSEAEQEASTLAAAAWHGLASVDIQQGEYESAFQKLQVALRILQEIDDRLGEAGVWHQLGVIEERQGNYDAARENFEKSLAIEQELENPVGEAGALHGLATVDRHHGDYDAARAKLRRALEIERQFGNRVGEIATRLELASLDAEQGQYELARQEYRAVLEIAQQIGDLAHEADSWFGIASVDERQGHFDAAREKFLRVLDVRERTGDRANAAAAWRKLSILDVHQGRYDQAGEAAQKALDISQSIGDVQGQQQALHQLASIDLRRGDYGLAKAKFERALEQARVIGDPSGEASALHQLGTVDLMLGDAQAARSKLEDASALQAALGRETSEAGTRLQLASLDMGEGDLASARRRLEDVLEVRRRTGAITGEANALHQLAAIDLEERNFPEARQKLARTLQLTRETGLRDGEAAAHHMLGTIAILEDHPRLAIEELRESLRIRQEMGDTLGASTVWYQLAVVAVQLGKIALAAQLAGLAFLIQKGLGHARSGSTFANLQFLAGQLGAGQLGLDEEQLESLLRDVSRSYENDQGESLLRDVSELEPE